MLKRMTLGLFLAAALLAGTLPALAVADLDAALDYLRTQQNPDGGFGSGIGPDSTVSSTADAVLAIVAAGGDLASFNQGGNTPLAYLAGRAAATSTGGDLAKLILAAVAAGENPRRIGGVDAVAKLEALAGADGRIGSAQDTFFSHFLAVLALKSVERPIPPTAVDLIREAQQENGGWAWDGSDATAADTNTTALAVQALVAAGLPADDPIIIRALSYYGEIQNEDGGWPYQNPSDFGTATDANSTAVTIQALIAAGEDPAGAEWTSSGGQTPVAALEALQNESGGFAWQAGVPGDNLLATVQAIPALAGKAFPLRTMAVGAAQATPAPTAAAPAGTPAATPVVMPVSGGPGFHPAWLLILAGLSLVVAGLALAVRRKAT